jgi:hypothetical protein
MPTLGHVGAINPEAQSGGKTSVNPAKPSTLEFKCDVYLAIQAACPKNVSLVDFCIAYLLFDSDDEIERNVYALKILGPRCHSVEQRVGAEFVRRKIFPVQGKGYFYAPRS